MTMQPIGFSVMIWASIFAISTPAQAQQDSLRLATLQQEAREADSRIRQLELQSTQSELRTRNVVADWWPSFTLQGQAQYQSDVMTFPSFSPTGQPFANPPHDTYDVFLGVQQRLFDPSLSPRRAAERAQLVESQARVHTALYALRQEVNDAFFSAVLLQERVREIDAVIADLEARLKETEARFAEGVVLPGDVASIKAVLLQRRQDRLEVQANRRSALAVLSRLTGRTLNDATPLAVPHLSDAVSRARTGLDTLRARPEYAQFASTRDRLSRQTSLISAQERPRLSAYGRTGYGKPGLNMMNRKFDSYWLAGLQIQWAPWNWHSGKREREAIVLQQQIVTTEESAFTQALRRGIERDLSTIERIDSALVLDDEIVTLREQIEQESRIRFQEGVITAADYLDRTTDVLQARLARAARRVERAQAEARVLTTLGVEIR